MALCCDPGGELSNSVISNGVDVSFVHEKPVPCYAEQTRVFLASSPSQFCRDPVSLEWDEIFLTVPQNKRVKRNRSNEKRVLSGVSGSVKSGQMLAIMGVSGCGKTSLLNILSGRSDTPNAKLTGTVNVNGAPRDWHKFRHQAAYVLQDGALFGQLTVREQVLFSASLRLPSCMPSDEKGVLVDRILAELGLTDVQDMRIGNKFTPGVSGGERKRTSIAMEIVTDPSILFLDEPTSGLDSANALRITQTLRHLASNKRTIVCTVHSPRSDMFALFDQLLVLSEGRVVYSGSARQATAYFATLGFRSPLLYNPADFLIDLLTIDYRSYEAMVLSKARIDYISKRYRPLKVKQNHVDIENMWRDRSSSFYWEKFAEDMKPQRERTFQNTRCTEVKFLLRRSFKLFMRSKVPNMMRFFQMLVFGLLLGTIWLNKGEGTGGDGYMSVPGLLFFIAINQCGAAYTVLFSFPLERTVITRERTACMYRTSSYFTSKTIVDSVKCALFTMIFCPIVYLMARLRPNIASFGLFYLAVLMMTLFVESLAVCVSVITCNVQAASSLVTVFIVLFLLFGGFFIGMNQMPSWIAPLQWTSCIYFCFNAMMTVQFPRDSTDNIVRAVRKEFALNTLSYWGNVSALAAMTVFMKLVTYLLLQYFRTPRFLKL